MPPTNTEPPEDDAREREEKTKQEGEVRAVRAGALIYDMNKDIQSIGRGGVQTPPGFAFPGGWSPAPKIAAGPEPPNPTPPETPQFRRFVKIEAN